MNKYFFIGLGGFFGAISRYLMKEIPLGDLNNIFPLNTLIINITGSFILAFFLILALKSLKLKESIQLGISTGFLGAYTTFSTLCKETIFLLKGGYTITAVSYILTSTIVGMAVTFFAVTLAEKVANNKRREEDQITKLSQLDSEVD